MKQLFKYLPEPRNIFEEGFIRLSQPVALNDPFEGAFCNQNLDELASYFDDNQAHDYVYGDIPCIFRDDLASDFGMSRPPISVSSGH